MEEAGEDAILRPPRPLDRLPWDIAQDLWLPKTTSGLVGPVSGEASGSVREAEVDALQEQISPLRHAAAVAVRERSLCLSTRRSSRGADVSVMQAADLG